MNNQEKHSRALRYRLLAVSVGIALLLTVLVTVAACRAAANREDESESGNDSTLNLSGDGQDSGPPDGSAGLILPDGAGDGAPKETETDPAPSLAFTSNGNGTCHVSGIGTYQATFLQIPSTSPAGDRVIGIDSRAFAGCTTLQYVFLPAGITAIGEYAFDGCSGIEEFAVEEGNACFITENGVLFSRDKTALVCYPAAKTATTFTLREQVTQIYAGAFRSVPALKRIYYTGSVSDWASILVGPGNAALTALPLTCNYAAK